MRFLLLLLLPGCVTTTLGRTRVDQTVSIGACTPARTIALEVGWRVTEISSTRSDRCEVVTRDKFEVQLRNKVKLGPKVAIGVVHGVGGGVALGLGTAFMLSKNLPERADSTKSVQVEIIAFPLGIVAGVLAGLGAAGVVTLLEAVTDRTATEVERNTTERDLHTHPDSGVLKVSATAPGIQLLYGRANIANSELLETTEELQIDGDRLTLDSETRAKVLVAQGCGRASALDLNALSRLSTAEVNARVHDAKECSEAGVRLAADPLVSLLEEQGHRAAAATLHETSDAPER